MRRTIMAIDPTTETLRPFAEAARRLPPLRSSRPVSPATLWRWSAHGLKARGGHTIRLETIRIGGTVCTSEEALARFFRALSADEEEGGLAPAQTQTTAAAERILDAAGI
jgi:hypothetical protein